MLDTEIGYTAYIVIFLSPIIQLWIVSQSTAPKSLNFTTLSNPSYVIIMSFLAIWPIQMRYQLKKRYT